ncbi:hypothetical protein RFI_16263, partial [Reticulomyxa filosa]
MSVRSQLVANNEHGFLEQKEDQEADAWPLAELVDTVYLKCLLLVHPESVEGFVKDVKNQCNIPVSERKSSKKKKKKQKTQTELQNHEKYLELVYLYKSHEYHSKALDTIQKQAKWINGIELTIEYLQELGKNP